MRNFEINYIYNFFKNNEDMSMNNIQMKAQHRKQGNRETGYMYSVYSLQYV